MHKCRRVDSHGNQDLRWVLTWWFQAQIYTKPFFYPFLFPSLLKFIMMSVVFKAKPRKKGLKTELHWMKLMGSCSDVLCWLLDRGKSIPVLLNRESTKLILRTKSGHIYEIHRSFAKNRSNFHPFRHNLQISFATLNLTRANTLITVMHLWGVMEASGGRRYTQLQRKCHKSHTTSHNCSHLLLTMEPR